MVVGFAGRSHNATNRRTGPAIPSWPPVWYSAGMLHFLRSIGLTGDSPPSARGTVYDRIQRDLGHLDETRLEALAAFAGLLARAAFGDAKIAPAEERAMVQCLEEKTGLDEKEAELVAEIATNATEVLAGVEDYLLTRAFNEHATPEEKESLLDCLYEVAAADAVVTSTEDGEIKQIAKALLIPHARIMDIRLRYRDRLEVLRGMPG
ncbi:MAG: TerB family tellurite resistance protein [Deltaproteobacteria bacterium]|nr:TerB family tellurite resistance protein [Deltaproteobacteria bacterium]